LETAKSIILDIVSMEENVDNTPSAQPSLMIDSGYSKNKKILPAYVIHLVLSVKNVAYKQETCHHLMQEIHTAFKSKGIEFDNTEGTSKRT
jgi:hypothetical protein